MSRHTSSRFWNRSTVWIGLVPAPAPGFLGRYRLVFSSGAERINVRLVVTP